MRTTHHWKAIGRGPWVCQKCGANEPRENTAPELHWCPGPEPLAVSELRKFLPGWGYPPYAVAAICLELKERLGHS